MSRPVLMTVDDDPGVSRAVARDLRRKYGSDFRIVRAESGADALDALKELTLRGEPTAAILADYRMPAMNGIEFLEQAMDVVPRARRALLTAYADTDAAIRAINVVDVDHYLLKPWEPPEEKLYPVVDALIETWRSVGDRSVEETKVLGHRWSAESFAARDFLARNSVPYRWYNIEEPDGARLLAAAGATADDVPVVITPDGTALLSPSETEIAAAVGLTTTPTTDFYDLVVIGGGPAGLGSAVYGASEGLRTVLVERQATGGQAGQSSRIENYLGFPDGVSGAQLTDRARRQAVKFGAEVLTTREVTALEPRGAKRVHLVVRGDRLERSMSQYLVEQIRAIDTVEVHLCTEVVGGEGDDHLERITLRDNSANETRTVDTSWLFVFIGAAPCTDWLDGVVERDRGGVVLARPDLGAGGRRPRGWDLDRDPYHLETSLPGVFVAGDARAESVKRVASAVGEGAMAVTLVHRYLEKL